MFGNHYFAGRYFPDRYFPPGGQAAPEPEVPPTPVPVNAGAGWLEAAEKRLEKYRNYGKDYIAEEKLARARQIIEEARNADLPADIFQLYMDQLEAEIAQGVLNFQQMRDEKDIAAILRLLAQEEIELVSKILH